MASKAVREAKAALDAVLAQKADLERQLREAETGRKPFVDALSRVRARRRRIPVVSNTGGQLWIGTLGELHAETYGARTFAGKSRKAIAEAITTGNLKLSGRLGVNISLRGLAGRVRTPDKALLRTYNRSVAARKRADEAQRKAVAAERAAFQALFDQSPKIPTEAILPGLVDEVIAFARLEAQPEPHDLRRALRELADPDWTHTPLAIAKAHYDFAKSGSSEPCPCSNCAADRADAIKLRDLNARLDGLPVKMLDCPVEGHGRHKAPFEVQSVDYYVVNQQRANWRAFAAEKGFDAVVAWLDSPASRTYGQSYGIPVVWCRKGDRPRSLVMLSTLNDTLAKKVRAKSGRIANEFICPNPECGERSPYLPDDGSVTCEACEVTYDADAVKVVKPEKAAA